MSGISQGVVAAWSVYVEFVLGAVFGASSHRSQHPLYRGGSPSRLGDANLAASATLEYIITHLKRVWKTFQGYSGILASAD